MESGIGCMLTCVVRRFLSPRHCPASLQPQAAPSPIHRRLGLSTFSGASAASFVGYSVSELINAASAFSTDCDLPDKESLTKLRTERPSVLPRWQLLRLVGICRHVAGLPLPFQEDLEAA